MWLNLVLFSFKKNLQNFLDSPSYRIFRRMHEVLNIDERIDETNLLSLISP